MLLGVLELPDDDRIDFIAHMHLRDDGQGLAESLTDLESDLVRTSLGSG